MAKKSTKIDIEALMQRLIKLMDKQGLSSYELSERIKANIGTDPYKAINNLIKGISVPQKRTLQRIAEELNVPLSYLERGEEEQKKEKIKIISDTLPPKPSLLGREKELMEMKGKFLDGSKLTKCAFHGIPGVGKSALILALVYDNELREHFDGILWAGLGKNGDVMEHIGRWAEKLGISQEALKGLPSIEQRTREIRAAIGEQRMLLVVDDVWELESAFAFLVGGPNCVHAITTRRSDIAAKFSDERPAIPVRELEEEDSFKLLKKYAQTNFEDVKEKAQELVQEVGGLPLALILMGRYLRTEGHSHDATRLEEAIDRLVAVKEERLRLKEPQRQQEQHTSLPEDSLLSLEAIIQISYEALKQNERSALRALSVFPPKPNSFSRDAALAVADTTSNVLYALYDSGLLESTELSRYYLHKTIADFASTIQSHETTFRKMVRFFANYIETYERDYNALELETDNILAVFEAAVKYNMHSEFIQCVNAFYHFLEVRGLHEIAEKLLVQAKEKVGVLKNEQDTITFLFNLGSLAEKQGRYNQAEIYLQEGLEKATTEDLKESTSKLLLCLGKVRYRKREYNQAKEDLQKGLEIARKLNLREDVGGYFLNLGSVYYQLGDLNLAESYLKEGATIAQEYRLQDRVAGSMVTLSAIALRKSHYKEAEKYCEEGLKITRELRLHEITTFLLTNLGLALSNQGLYKQAVSAFEEGLEIAIKLKLQYSIFTLFENMGLMASKYGLMDEAARYLKIGLQEVKELEFSYHRCSLLLIIGELAELCGELDQAESLFQEGLLLAQKENYDESACEFLTKLGSLATKKGTYDDAERYLREGERIREFVDDTWIQNANKIAWGDLHLKRRDWNSAEMIFSEVLNIVKKVNIEDKEELEAEALFGLAQTSLGQNNPAEARRLGEMSLKVFKDIGHRGATVVKKWLEHLRQSNGIKKK